MWTPWKKKITVTNRNYIIILYLAKFPAAVCIDSVVERGCYSRAQKSFARVIPLLLRKFETGQTFSYVQTDVTTPKAVGLTMLGVVASICK